MRATILLTLVPTFALIAACAGSTDDEGADSSGADITAAAAGCAIPDRTYTGPGKVTATTSGVRCFDDKGAVAGSMGAQATVKVVAGSKTGAAKNPNRVSVTGTNTVDKKPLTCWLPTTYLCKGSGSITGVDAGTDSGRVTGIDSGASSSIFCEYPVSDGIRQAFIGDCRTVDGETTICLAPDNGDARWSSFDPSTTKCTGRTIENSGSACNTTLSDSSCSSSSASAFVMTCRASGGTARTAQTDTNGAIGAAQCACDCK